MDVNVLLYVVNRNSRHHIPVRSWWERALGGDEPIGLCWLVLLGFLRLSTNPKVFSKPLEVEEALDRVNAWLALPITKLVTESGEHWRILRDLLQSAGTAGNLTSDAHLAALALGNGAVLVSCDADFSRFPQLRWENPL